MPKMDGYRLMRQMKTMPQSKRISAIALTAYAGEIDRQEAKAVSLGLHLAKPVEPTQLLEAISNLIKDHQSQWLHNISRVFIGVGLSHEPNHSPSGYRD